jgi:cyanophycin synthetase
VAEPAARAVEIRTLEGPNLYFPRPAVKLTMSAGPWVRASRERVERAAERLGLTIDPGAPGSDRRRRALCRIAARWASTLATTQGVRIATRARPGPETDEIVVAFPWRRRAAAEAFAAEIAAGMGAILVRSPTRVAREAAVRLAGVEPGDEPASIEPDIPVVQITGTNGKTTTVRLLAHLVRASGERVAYSSTDGVYRDDGELVESGDYSGFGGAAMAIAEHPDVAVLETARGGILLRGSGVMHNDVAVVTNVSEDHVGLLGVRTLDQLAEVKATITRITRARGWDVLNADDPRVLAMERAATGRPWLFSVDPHHPALRRALNEGGRAMTVSDGAVTWLERHDTHPLVPIVDVPSSLAGLSGVYTQNVLAAAAAGLAIGLPERGVIKGLKTFILDPERNPGRANLFRLAGRIVVVDYAHNEAGMTGLTEVLNGLRRKGRDVWLAICTAGDRTDEILRGFAFRAARGSDHLAVAHLRRYLRGRAAEDVLERLREGAGEAGVEDVAEYDDELHALRAMIEAAAAGDVVGVTALGQRAELFAWLADSGAERLTPAVVKRLVRAVARSNTPVIAASA